MSARLFLDEMIFSVADGISSAELDGEAVLLNVNSGQYFKLNEIGARIMSLVQRQTSLGTIRKSLLEEFEVESEQLERDIILFLSDMTEHRLIRIVDNALVPLQPDSDG